MNGSTGNPHLLSLNDLSDDLLYQILFFLPSLKQLQGFAFCSKRTYNVIHHSPISDHLFAALYQHAFGDAGSKKHWKAHYGIRQCAVQASLRQPTTATGQGPTCYNTTMGLLTAKQERQAFLYDNGSMNANLCIGYFGIKEVWEGGPVCVWGDFDGVRLFSSLDLMLGKDRTKDDAVIVAHDESVVLTVMTHGTALFLGCASGKVLVVRAIMVETTNCSYSYHPLDTATYHTNEVTSLSMLMSSPPQLLSASCDGTVWAYPDAITKACLNGSAYKIGSTDEPILCIHAVGDDSLWTAMSSGASLFWKRTSNETWVKQHGFESSTTHTQIVSFTGFQGGIIGDNEGTIHFVNETTDESPQQQPTECRIQRPAETMTRYGDIIIVGGGIHDGGISLIQLEQQPRDDTTLPFGKQYVLKCHPGKKLHGTIAFSSVVSTLVSLTRQSLITLSRDGSIAEWRFDTSNIAGTTKRKQKCCKRPRPLSQTINMPCNPTLSDLMNHADAQFLARTRLRIIQCAFQQQHTGTPSNNSVGLEGMMEKGIATAFSLCSDLGKCSSCTDPYSCRIFHRHTQALDLLSYPAQLFVMLVNDATNTTTLMSHIDWYCDTCHVDNRGDASSPCRLCQSSQLLPNPCLSSKQDFDRTVPSCTTIINDNNLPAIKPRSLKKQAVDVQSVEVMKQPPNTVKMWECIHCFHLNRIRKYHCTSCNRQGGIILFIPEDEVL